MVGVVETDIAELKNFYELIKREYRQEMNKHTTAPTKDSWVRCQVSLGAKWNIDGFNDDLNRELLDLPALFSNQAEQVTP